MSAWWEGSPFFIPCRFIGFLTLLVFVSFVYSGQHKAYCFECAYIHTYIHACIHCTATNITVICSDEWKLLWWLNAVVFLSQGTNVHCFKNSQIMNEVTDDGGRDCIQNVSSFHSDLAGCLWGRPRIFVSCCCCCCCCLLLLMCWWIFMSFGLGISYWTGIHVF
jgi:hypothetical protein